MMIMLWNIYGRLPPLNIEYCDIDYVLHTAGGGDVEGVIQEGGAQSFCVEPGACSVIVRTTLEWSYYFVLFL